MAALAMTGTVGRDSPRLGLQMQALLREIGNPGGVRLVPARVVLETERSHAPGAGEGRTPMRCCSGRSGAAAGGGEARRSQGGGGTGEVLNGQPPAG
jgi:hypothetical protein